MTKRSNPDEVLGTMITLKDELESALAEVQALILMANEVHMHEWGQDVWDEEAEGRQEALRFHLDGLALLRSRV